jgi:exodeoxyribonuclease III
VRLITWNVNRRLSVLAEQAAALAGRAPDVVALQEVTASSWPLWRAALQTIGLPHALCSLDDADRGRQPIERRRSGVALATRSPLALAERLPVPWPETTLAAGSSRTRSRPCAPASRSDPVRACCAGTSTRRAARSPTAR